MSAVLFGLMNTLTHFRLTNSLSNLIISDFSNTGIFLPFVDILSLVYNLNIASFW